MKPSRESYEAILHQLAVSPQNSLFVDDSSVNIRGAQLAGLQTVLFSPSIDLRRIILSRFPQLSL
jgi:HAD superfamily hydrolase (TIGR01509 family)